MYMEGGGRHDIVFCRLLGVFVCLNREISLYFRIQAQQSGVGGGGGGFCISHFKYRFDV